MKNRNQAKRLLAVFSATSVLIAGCASPQTQAQLDAANAACAAGDPNACTAAYYTAQQAQAEAQTNAALTIGVLSVIGTAALLASGPGHPGPGPHPPPRFH
jgi:hypothetical protein